jgi:hypothetical protein
VTINDDDDIAIAAISGVTNHITANVTATALYANARPFFLQHQSTRYLRDGEGIQKRRCPSLWKTKAPTI